MNRTLTAATVSALVLFLPLTLSGAELSDAACYECHDDLQKNFARGMAHEPVAEGDCEACHDDHGEDYGLILTEEVPDLCFGCHDEFSEKYIHEPVAGGDCLECHDTHQSEKKALLVEGYSDQRYLKYSAENYQLCFNCHEQEAFENPGGDGLTEFRQRDSNLHYLHVYGQVEVNKYGMRKEKDGMTCFSCHLTHGTDQPKLVRPVLECSGTFCYTINFRKFEGGGACVVGCHKPKVYKTSTLEQASSPEKEKPLTPLARQGQSGILKTD